MMRRTAPVPVPTEATEDPRFPPSRAACAWLEKAPDRPAPEREPLLPPATGYWIGLGGMVGIGLAAIAAGWGIAP